jgi:hypothetical protein
MFVRLRRLLHCLSLTSVSARLANYPALSVPRRDNQECESQEGIRQGLRLPDSLTVSS